MPRYGRGTPAHARIYNSIIIIAVSDTDSISSLEGQSVAASTTSTDVFGTVLEATSIAARFTDTDVLHSSESTGSTAAEPEDNDDASSLEQSTIVATLSHSDDGSGVESGPPPPPSATLASDDARTGVDSYGVVSVASNDPAFGVEGTPTVAFVDTESLASAEDQDVDTFGGDSKLGQDASNPSSSASSIVATLSSSDTGSLVDDNPYQGVNDTEPIFSIDADPGGPGVLGTETIGHTETESIVAIITSSDVTSSLEADPSQVGVSAPVFGNDPAQIRDNGITPIDLYEDEPVSIVDANSALRLASLDTASYVEATSIVNTIPTQNEPLTSSETEESPDVNLPIGTETLHYLEGQSVPSSTLSSSDTISLVDTEDVDRGTPPSRLFVVEQEVRMKVIDAVTRVLEIPAEVRVRVVSGGFQS